MQAPDRYRWPANFRGDFSHPCIVGTLSVLKDTGSIEAAAEACDVVELRHDLLHLTPAASLDLARALLKKGKGVIFTCRLQQEGGQWPDDSRERLNLLVDALNLGALPDIEGASPFADLLIQRAEELNRWVILSTHDFEKTPSLDILRSRCRMEDTRPCIIHKAAAQLASPADISVLENLITENPDLSVCAMGMGTMGPQSRIQLAHAGSCLTYGYLDRPAAPGQYSCQELRSAFQSAGDGSNPDSG